MLPAEEACTAADPLSDSRARAAPAGELSMSRSALPDLGNPDFLLTNYPCTARYVGLREAFKTLDEGTWLRGRVGAVAI